MSIYNSPMEQAIFTHGELIRKANEQDSLQAVLREMCRKDLFFLLYWGLGREDIKHPWLFERCREVQYSPDGHLDLWSREHYKSTIITFAKTIQDILRDPEITVGIFSHTRPIAKGFLRQIKQELEGNVRLKQLFPDILWSDPRKQSPKWSEDDGITVKRKTNPAAATVEAWGLVDAQPVGKHFKRPIYDDVVTPASVTTPDQIAKTTEAWALSLNLWAEGGAGRYIGTRYHYADTYREIMKRGAAKPRLHPATDDGTMTGKPVMWSQATFDRKRREMGPFVAACQLLQDPKADDVQGFKEEWLRFYDPRRMDWGGMNRYILCDPAGEKKRENDYSAFFVLALGRDKNYYILDIVRDRLSLTERANVLFSLHRQYQPLGVGYEKYGMQSDIEHYQDRMERENYRFDITKLGGSLAKNDRIRKLIPVFEQGRVWMPRSITHVNYEGIAVDVVQSFIDDEYKAFPVGQHDDMLDCLARIVDPDLLAVFPQVEEFVLPRREGLRSPAQSY